jgi:hypothetical protein
MVRHAANRRIREAFDQLEREIAAGRPPADDYDLRIDRDGTWRYRGSPIERPAIVKLFASILHRASDGSYWLVTPAERTRVHVEDVPFVGVELAVRDAGAGQRLELRTHLGEWVPIDRAHPLTMRPQSEGGAAPYVDLGGGLEARVARNVFYELADLAEPDAHGRGLGVRSHGTWFPLEEDAGESAS